MGTINEAKQLTQADTPLLFFECVFPTGQAEYWCSHSIMLGEQAYEARVLKHDLFDLQLSSDDAMDGISRLSLVLANADSELSELNAAVGFKGSQITVHFAFADLTSGVITTESTVLFRGIAGDPEQITESTLTLSFNNKLSLQRIPVPDARIQRSCPWNFPSSSEQRTEAKDGGSLGQFSRYYRCGYSADVTGGTGNLSAGKAFTACDKSRAQCIERGMFDRDSGNSTTRRFGAFDYVPSAINVRTAGNKSTHLSAIVDNSAKYNDAVPIVYGTGWLKSPVTFARNDGNLTHMEVLIGLGPIQGVLKVIVNDVEIPQGISGQSMAATGWFNIVSDGGRQGNFNTGFLDANGAPAGDPYGNMAVLSIVVPNSVSSGKSLPHVEVLVQGLILERYNSGGSIQSTAFSNNPAWVILNLLRRCGWTVAELNLASFAAAAAFCGELIRTTDLNGNTIYVPRFECNLVLTKRQSAATLVRGIRVASSLMLRYGLNGLLELLPETTSALQQPTLPDGGNSVEQINGGWPAYEFSDGSEEFSGIARNADGSSSVVLTSRSIAETSNRLSVEFQDESNEYQQDSLSLVDSDDLDLIGYEVSSQSTAIGVANFSQATRVLLRQLDKSTKGNLFLQFTTSFRALKVRPGDIIAITYLREGLIRAPFRVVKLSPSTNYAQVTILAQKHDDDWYSDDPAVLRNAGRQPGAGIGLPKPLIGLLAHQDVSGSLEYFDFEIKEALQERKDGSATDTLTVGFSQPLSPSAQSLNLPLISLTPGFSNSGGTIAGGSRFYYAVSALDAANNEGSLSFTVPADVPGTTATNQVIMTGLSFPKNASSFNVYRGTTPQQLYRIAQGQPLSATYTDSGVGPMPAGPPDPNFDHANFYYRFEYAGSFIADRFSSNTIGRSDMNAVSLVFVGMVVRIIEGTGRGQERLIQSNDETTLTLQTAWSVTPDVTSIFVVSEGSWRFGAVARTSPVQFEVPYQTGSVIQVLGRAANINNLEASLELSTITRLSLGGGNTDASVPEMPDFSLSAPGGGELALSGIGFNDLKNTYTVSSGTLQIFYWSELAVGSMFTLAAGLDAQSTTVKLATGMGAGGTTLPRPGDTLAIGSELITLLATQSDPLTFTAARASLSSASSAHDAGQPVQLLSSTTFVVPFALGFFENRATQNYRHSQSLPDVRICAAQFQVVNAFGRSETNQQCYLGAQTPAVRTLSGGQFSIQVSGALATQTNASPPLIIEASHAVRDVRATLGQATNGYTVGVAVLQNGELYCSLTIAAGKLSADPFADGAALGPLLEGATLTLNVTLTPISGVDAGSLVPGRDLTITVRL